MNLNNLIKFFKSDNTCRYDMKVSDLGYIKSHFLYVRILNYMIEDKMTGDILNFSIYDCFNIRLLKKNKRII